MVKIIFPYLKIKGKLKLDKEITSTNPIAVGDHVEIEPEEGTEHSAMIRSIEKRTKELLPDPITGFPDV